GGGSDLVRSFRQSRSDSPRGYFRADRPFRRKGCPKVIPGVQFSASYAYEWTADLVAGPIAADSVLDHGVVGWSLGMALASAQAYGAWCLTRGLLTMPFCSCHCSFELVTMPANSRV